MSSDTLVAIAAGDHLFVRKPWPRTYSEGHFHGDGCGLTSADRLISWGVDSILGMTGDDLDSEFAAFRTHRRKLSSWKSARKSGSIFSRWLRQIHGAARGIATSAPRGIHLLNGHYEARRHGAPVLTIIGHTLHVLFLPRSARA